MNSNLPLQMALYFNVIFLPIWSMIMLLFLINKVFFKTPVNNIYCTFMRCFQYSCYSELYKFITVAVILTVITIEIFRLYLGYEGNLCDKVRHNLIINYF